MSRVKKNTLGALAIFSLLFLVAIIVKIQGQSISSACGNDGFGGMCQTPWQSDAGSWLSLLSYVGITISISILFFIRQPWDIQNKRNTSGIAFIVVWATMFVLLFINGVVTHSWKEYWEALQGISTSLIISKDYNLLPPIWSFVTVALVYTIFWLRHRRIKV